MAKTIPYRNKDGKIVSYQIQVSRGYDSSGKKLKPFCESWKVPEGYKSEKAIENALKKRLAALKQNVQTDVSTTISGRFVNIPNIISDYQNVTISEKPANAIKKI